MTKNRFIYSFVAGILVFPLCLVNAQEKGKGKGRPGGGGGFQPPSFADVDTNESGDLDKEEWIAYQVKAARERAERSFGYVAGDDELVTEEEYKKLAQRRGGSSKGGPSGGKGGPGGGKGGPGGGEKGMSKGKGKGKGGDTDTGSGTKPKRPEIEE